MLIFTDEKIKQVTLCFSSGKYVGIAQLYKTSRNTLEMDLAFSFSLHCDTKTAGKTILL